MKQLLKQIDITCPDTSKETIDCEDELIENGCEEKEKGIEKWWREKRVDAQ